MLAWWMETNVTAWEEMVSSGADYSDQVTWVPASHFEFSANDTSDYLLSSGDPDYDLPVGLLLDDHENFSAIVQSVRKRMPGIVLKYADATDFLSVLSDGGGNGSASWHPSSASPSAVRGDACPGTGGATAAQMATFAVVERYLSRFAKSTLSACGILANAAAAYVLTNSRRLRGNSFNALLTGLLVVHSLYLFDGLAMEMYMSWARAAASPSPVFHHLFSKAVFPLHPLLLYTSTCVTVLMARERCLAIRNPILFRNQSLSGQLWARSAAQIAASFAASALFALPLFFESEVLRIDGRDGQSEYRLRLTDLRTDRHYVLWYRNVAMFLLTVLIPFVLLFYFNGVTVALMRQRRKKQSRDLVEPPPPPAAAVVSMAGDGTGNGMGHTESLAKRAKRLKNEEMSVNILVALSFIFLICNSIRIVVVLEELASSRDYKLAVTLGCNAMPLWVLMTNRVSLFLLTLNACLAPAIYCAMSAEFRSALVLRLRRATHRAKRVLGVRNAADGSFDDDEARMASFSSPTNRHDCNNRLSPCPQRNRDAERPSSDPPPPNGVARDHQRFRTSSLCLSNGQPTQHQALIKQSPSVPSVLVAQLHHPDGRPRSVIPTQPRPPISPSASPSSSAASSPPPPSDLPPQQPSHQSSSIVLYRIPALPLRSSSSVRSALKGRSSSNNLGVLSA